MKELILQSGTRAEIIEYLHQKIKRKIDNPTDTYEEDENDVFELTYDPVESQIDQYINSGSPMVVVTLRGGGFKDRRYTFIVSDYADIKTEMEIKRLDDPELRQRRIDAIKAVINMELDAKDRWDRILKIVDEFHGQVINLK